MASTSVRAGENHGLPVDSGTRQLIRVILADTQAIFSNSGDLDGFAMFKLFGPADETQPLAGFKLAGVFLLGHRP